MLEGVRADEMTLTRAVHPVIQYSTMAVRAPTQTGIRNQGEMHPIRR